MRLYADGAAECRRERMREMTRSNAREIAVHFTFELGFSDLNADELLERNMTEELFAQRSGEADIYAKMPDKPQEDYISGLVRGVFSHGAELDGYISQYAKGWRFSRIDRVAAAIMRVTMYEILYMPEVPNKVAINEAVEIAKKYLDDDVVKFVNGILGSFVRAEFPEEN